MCELQLRALVLGVPGGRSDKIVRVIGALERAALVAPALGARLRDLCVRRNRSLHSGAEPGEEVALEALRLATEMLRAVVPDLVTRVVRGLLLL